jgi:hypothetical protein
MDRLTVDFIQNQRYEYHKYLWRVMIYIHWTTFYDNILVT